MIKSKVRKARIFNPPVDTDNYRPVSHDELVTMKSEDSFGGRFYEQGIPESTPVIEFRVSGEFSHKGLYLNKTHYDFELVTDDEDALVLLPTRKQNPK